MASAPDANPAVECGVLQVVSGNDLGKRFELRLEETRIGRGLDQDLTLADITVSRRHVVVDSVGTRYRLRDLGSGNGTQLNGRRIDEAFLCDGDDIEIGHTVMRFEHPTSRPSTLRGHAEVEVPESTWPGFPAPGPPDGAGAGGEVLVGSLEPLADDAAPQGKAPPDPLQPKFWTGPRPHHPESVRERAAAHRNPPGRGSGGGAPVTPAAGQPDRQTQPTPLPGGREATPRATRRPGPSLFSGRGGAAASQALLVVVLGVCIGAGGALAYLGRSGGRAAAAPPRAEQLYLDAMANFAAGSYETARAELGEVLVLAPESQEVRHYLRHCDLELKAREALSNADRALERHRYLEAMQAVQEVDASSLLLHKATRLRAEAARQAAAEDIVAARRLLGDDPTAARVRLERALSLSPLDGETRELLDKLRNAPWSQPGAAAPVKPPVVSRPSDPICFRARAVLAPYRARDFLAAEKACRLLALNQVGARAQTTVEVADELKALRLMTTEAAGSEATEPAQAIERYESALAVDAKLSHGAHAVYFRRKLSALASAAARRLFDEGRYEPAYQAARAAHKYGAAQPALFAQLETKAGELVERGQGLEKSDLEQARGCWRTVLKIVPPTSPLYAKAYSLLNNPASKSAGE